MYRGRFAPSPTGLLHIGSLLTAVASYADARANNGKWLVRIEDLDPPREMKGAADHILWTLEAFGLEWDDRVIYQSQRHDLYVDALDSLKKQGWVYPCYCSRKDWQAVALCGIDGLIYNGNCRSLLNRPSEKDKQHAWRIKVSDEIIEFHDGIVGHYVQNLARDIGDFVLLRADGHWAYQLAVVVDDAEQGITHIVRGQDLLISTPRQIYLQRCLKISTPNYIHLPLLVNKMGQKWSKQTQAPALNLAHQEMLLRQIMVYLNLPIAPQVNKPGDLLTWIVDNWCVASVPKSDLCTQ